MDFHPSKDILSQLALPVGHHRPLMEAKALACPPQLPWQSNIKFVIYITTK